MPRPRTKIRPTVQSSLSSNPLECTHYFQLPSLGGEVLGVCTSCGLEKVHYNSTNPEALNPWRNKKTREEDAIKLGKELNNAKTS